MKKSFLTKGILVLVVVAFLAVGFTGCGTVICTTATVNITTPDDSYWYEIYIDGNYWDTTNSSGNITLYGVPTGYHTFYAVSTDNYKDGYAYPTIVCGVNNVAINTYLSCTTATVNITTPLDSWYYYIYIDGVSWGMTNSVGNITLYGVPTGYHTFYAVSTDNYKNGYAYPTIVCGVNNVAINTYH